MLKNLIAIVFVGGLAALVFSTGSCTKMKGPQPSGGQVCDSTKVSYARDVKGIFDARCATSGCHDAATNESGVNLSDYAGSKTGVESRNAICNMQASSCSQMPPDQKLSDSIINVVVAWKNNGYCN
ncbi:MAG: hypothetical protein U0T84_05840 [Chitinophagales bacterium]